MSQGITSTSFQFPGQVDFYRGKVRDVYIFEKTIAVVATDRISAFDVVLPVPIPYKGQVLNQIAFHFLSATAAAVPNWVSLSPDPNVTLGKRCTPFKVEMVIRGYLAGHAWREYRDGKRVLCGVPLPDGLKENDPLPEPIITPTTKASEGHDEDISRDAILKNGIVSEKDYLQLEAYTRTLFRLGTEMAREKGLVLVDTKYEFGSYEGEILLIDEIHTPDSSRYFYLDGYAERQAVGEPQKQLSKEFVRQWLIENGFQGKPGQSVPEMSPEIVASISHRYIELFEHITGKTFVPADSSDMEARIKAAILEHI
ncbi:phosphoribosylaminoimidazolesuccinocarboxamide synthase [Cyclobacterium xiamenense]|uniref:phosphoribosylaminoimidazolesuccinocarboxamide synthase n=1 Tax=Cyclobacterium xiamenense TaxID=1297121 RepID=UPI0012B82FEB|nr:phosphoribosylaminoimidazolesuccinocarboxamide synthase [Cyclobacterium xiamenense]